MVEDLRVLGVGPIKAGGDGGSPGVTRVRVEGVVVGPAVVGGPGVIAALECYRRFAVVLDDEYDVTLPMVLRG